MAGFASRSDVQPAFHGLWEQLQSPLNPLSVGHVGQAPWSSCATPKPSERLFSSPATQPEFLLPSRQAAREQQLRRSLPVPGAARAAAGVVGGAGPPSCALLL